MARTNKYTSLNFNDIYEKKSNSSSSQRPNSSSPSSSSSSPVQNKTVFSNSRFHGHMLVLSRPTPKPISIPQSHNNPDHKLQSSVRDSEIQAEKSRSEPESDSISLRPQGRTGSGPGPIVSPAIASPTNSTSPLQKSDRFVPPHLRPGFVGREEKPTVPNRQRSFGSPSYGDGRPKSGGGYERMFAGGDAEPAVFLNRPKSGGGRPRSSG